MCGLNPVTFLCSIISRHYEAFEAFNPLCSVALKTVFTLQGHLLSLGFQPASTRNYGTFPFVFPPHLEKSEDEQITMTGLKTL